MFFSFSGLDNVVGFSLRVPVGLRVVYLQKHTGEMAGCRWLNLSCTKADTCIQIMEARMSSDSWVELDATICNQKRDLLSQVFLSSFHQTIQGMILQIEFLRIVPADWSLLCCVSGCFLHSTIYRAEGSRATEATGSWDLTSARKNLDVQDAFLRDLENCYFYMNDNCDLNKARKRKTKVPELLLQGVWISLSIGWYLSRRSYDDLKWRLDICKQQSNHFYWIYFIK